MEGKYVSITQLWQGIGQKMLSDFEDIQSHIPHAGERGSQAEKILRRFLQRYLPGRLSVGTGHILAQKGEVSRQCDVVIYDGLYWPSLFVADGYQIFPVESVLAVIEVKSTLDGKSMKEAAENIRSVKSLAEQHPICGMVFAYSSNFRPTPSIIKVANRLQLLNQQIEYSHRIDLINVLDDGLLYRDKDLTDPPTVHDDESKPHARVAPHGTMLVFSELDWPNLLAFFYFLLYFLSSEELRSADTKIHSIEGYSHNGAIGTVMLYPVEELVDHHSTEDS